MTQPPQRSHLPILSVWILATLVMGYLAWHLGHWVGTNPKWYPKAVSEGINARSSQQIAQAKEKSKQSDQTQSGTQGLKGHTTEPSPAPTESLTPQATESEINPTYAAAIQKLGLIKLDSDMSQTFSSTPAGFALRATTTLFRFRTIQAEEGRIASEQLAWAKAHSAETFQELKQGLGKMKPEYGAEHQYLVQLVSELEIEKSEKVSFFSEQLIKDAHPDAQNGSGQGNSEGLGTYNALIALQSLLSQVESPTDAEPALRQALAKSNPAGRHILLNAYEQSAPAAAQALRQEYLSGSLTQ